LIQTNVNKPNPRFNLNDKVTSTGNNLGVVVERDYFDGARLAGMVRVPGIDPALNAGWKYLVVGNGFSDRWYDEGSLARVG
jgi:hypothetical protein